MGIGQSTLSSMMDKCSRDIDSLYAKTNDKAIINSGKYILVNF